MQRLLLCVDGNPSPKTGKHNWFKPAGYCILVLLPAEVFA